MIRVPAEVGEFLARYDRYLVVGHIEPDGDCVASAVALARFLDRRGKRVVLADQGPFDRPEVASFQPLFQAEPPPPAPGSAAVVVDCSTADRLGPVLETAVAGLPVLVIDHHSSGNPFGEVRWVEPSAPAVAYLVQLLLESLGERLPAEDAELLLFGLSTDTGFFRHLGPGPGSGEALRAAARLVEAGASPQRVYRSIHTGWSPSRVNLLAEALRRAESLFDGQLLLTWWTLEDFRKAGAAFARGSDEVYRILSGVAGCEVIVFLRQDAPRRFSVGFRSASRVDVGVLAQSMGGGGHARAAGCTLTGTLSQVRRAVLAALSPLLALPPS
jgi:phosphoesterase RecJ-like protein